MGPPKHKRAPAESPLLKRLRIAYYIAGVFANIFEKPFGFFERWHWRIADQIENERDQDNAEEGRA